MRDILIGPETLDAMRREQPLRIIDVRPRPAYESGHIPGAVQFDVARFNRPQPPVNGLLPEVDKFDEAAAELGLHRDLPVVVCDEAAGPSAGRTAWTLTAFGHPAVHLLDGGLRGWEAAGLPLDTAVAAVEPGAFRGEPAAGRIADRRYILEHLGDKEVQLLDARTRAEYLGDDRRAARGGHIPGAVHLDWTETKTPDNSGYFKNRDELEALLRERGLDKNREVICYCQSHQRSALLAVLLEALGYSRVRGYPGAWSDWGNRSDTPVEL